MHKKHNIYSTSTLDLNLYIHLHSPLLPVMRAPLFLRCRLVRMYDARVVSTVGTSMDEKSGSSYSTYRAAWYQLQYSTIAVHQTTRLTAIVGYSQLGATHRSHSIESELTWNSNSESPSYILNCKGQWYMDR